MAAATLAEALELWRGDQLAEAVSEPLRAEATRLDQVRTAAIEARLEAGLACGGHRQGLPELQALCRAHPLRESLWAMQITALYRCARQADALAAYQDLRRTLAEELGIDPSSRLRQLEAAVLAQDPALAAPERPRSRAGPLSFPTPLAVTERAPLVGRADELRLARAAWASAAGGTSAVVLVGGEAGGGKSRLVRELARGVQGPDGIVLHGRCNEDLAIPYRPFVECLSSVVAQLPDEVLDDAGPQWPAELARLVPAVASRRPDLPAPPPAEPNVERYQLFQSVASLLSALARQSPVLILLEDVHWADRPTLLLLRHLSGLDLGRVLLVATFRSSGRLYGPLLEALGALPPEARVTRIAPHRLSGAETTALVRASAASFGECEDELAEALHRQTDGNPFYLVEMLAHLRETGALGAGQVSSVGDLDVSAAGLPDSIREVLRARLARLGPAAERVLPDAAVIGQEFDLAVLAGSTGLDDDTVLGVLDVAARAALVEEARDPPGRFRFTHALVQQTLYRDLGATRRTRAHARVALAMEAVGGRGPGELAFHFQAGITRETTGKAFCYARAAGLAALATSAPDEAVRWHTAALNALPPNRQDEEHVRALVELGTAQRHAGQPAYRETLLAAARRAQHIGADDLLIDAALACSRGGFSKLGEVDAEKVAILEAALGVAAPDSVERARLLAVLAGELIWHADHVRRIRLADEAVEVARRTGDVAALLYAILQPGPATSVPETAEQRVRLLREAAEIAQRTNDRVASCHVVLLLAPMLVEVVCPDGIAHALDEVAEVLAQVGEPWDRLMVPVVQGCDRAEAHAGGVLRIGTDGGQPDVQEMHAELIYMIRWQQGRLREILPRLREVAAGFEDLPAYTAGFACAEALSGDAERARRMLRAAADNGFDAFYGISWLSRTCQWAEVAVEVADLDAAAGLYTALAPWKHLFAMSGPLPLHAVSLALGRLAALRGDAETAAAHYADALRIHEVVRSPFGIAQTALHWGRLLRRTDPQRARVLLDTAADLAHRFGFRDIARRAADGR
ncbi:MAG: AAA family ATPase [Actinobacteria bacterium]|nr:AAA family ATPase [Actinomycetota bacterium]MBW3646960.1 AAA family ATPase [Actinomycetota bacterium]